ncbi:fatty acid synthase-like [Tropilaelaps mercedesae]|uniref:Fatty acid synthase-like n=1 Tax=Tropilaelaps mercedesae TaxID=418985 RepID=A0A1V9WYJ0_9ACAR|nr:fatty acid synthase-like [Tropilaelaps mercedesae]
MPCQKSVMMANGTGPRPEKPKWQITDDIVLSGISGYFPQADGIEEFQRNLYGGVDMVTNDETRWPRAIHGLPERAGKIKEPVRMQSFNCHLPRLLDREQRTGSKDDFIAKNPFKVFLVS